MKKQILVISILLLLLSSCNSNKLEEVQTGELLKEEVQTGELLKEEVQTGELLKEEVQTGELLKEEVNNYAIYDLAVEKNNIGKCNDISDSVIRTKCKKDFIYYMKSKKNNDSLSCNNILNIKLKEKCINQIDNILVEKNKEYKNIAIKENNIDKCNDINNTFQSDLCKDTIIYNKINNIIENKLEESNEEDLFNTCNLLKDPNGIISCKNNIYYKKALNTKNLKICDKILNDEYEKKKCIKKIKILLGSL